MQLGIIEETQNADQNAGLHVREGGANRDTRRLLQDEAPDGFNFWFVRVAHNDEGDEAFSTPRHKHTFQQIKFVEKGRVDITPGVYLEEGDIGFSPRGAYYGPQSREKGPVTLGIQYGFNGEHQRGYYWEDARPATIAKLKENGKIEGGRYIYTDTETGETKTRDAVDALYDERYQMLKGKPLVIPPPLYEAPIIMHSRNASYFQAGPGLEMKYLGRFFDQPGPNGDVTIMMVKLTGGVFALRADRPQVAFALGEGLVVDGRTCPGGTAVYSPRGEDGHISAEGGVEVYIFEFPRLD